MTVRHLHRLALRLGIALAAACAAGSAFAQGQQLPDLFSIDEGAKREQVSQSDSENIDPLTGHLTLSVADVYLPGNGGFDLRVMRSYRADRASIYVPIGAGAPSLDVLNSFRKAERTNGVGWAIHFGRVIRENRFALCSNGPAVTSFDSRLPKSGSQSYSAIYETENPLLEMPDGSQQRFSFSSSGTPLLLTPQRWRADCVSGGLTVYSPEGIRYEMTQQVIHENSLISSWYATKITDRNGNYVDVTYAAPGSPEISSATTSDGRLVTFTYYDAGQPSRRVATVSAIGRTWQYGYDVQTLYGYSRHVLTSVTRPDSPATTWRYSYQASNFAPCAQGQAYTTYYTPLVGIANPTGGTVGYGHSCWKQSSGANNSYRVGVGLKSTSDGQAWNFAHYINTDQLPEISYSAPARSFDTTRVWNSAGQLTEYNFLSNPGLTLTIPGWALGLMSKKIVYGPGTAGQVIGRSILQSETFSWGNQQIGGESTALDVLVKVELSINNSNNGVISPIQTGIFAPVLSQRTVVRDGATYQATYSNHDGYGNPRTITESGPNGGTRTTNLTYYIDPVKWIVKQVDDETTVGVGSVIRGWDTNGNLLSENRDGVTTSYTRYATGDIATVTTPRGLISNFSNYKRGIAQVESHPESVNLSRIVSDSGNVESFTNGEALTTTFGYDPLDRLARVTPPLGNPTTITYTATTKTATRGALQQVETVDGFGRTINVTTGGVSVAATYDSLGRKTFGSIVGFPTVGHSFQYDVLDRVTRITHNADASYRSFTYGPASLAVRDERGHVTTHTYRSYGDPDKQLLMSIAAPVTSANVAITRNGRGQVTTATQGGFTRTFGYDSRYYLTSTIHPEIGTTVYGRDNAGNMTTKQVTAGPLGASGTTVYDYDGRDRLWRVTYPNGSPSTVTNTYWRTDKLKTATNAVATRSYGYDGNQNLKTESLVVDGLTMAATYNYTTNDQLSSIAYPVLNRTVSFNPDVLGRPTAAVTPTGSMLGVGFWPNGQIADIAFAGGSRVTYGQNTREWLNSVTVKTGDGVSRIASTLTHDVAGNLIGVADSVDASYNRTLTHDSINRLVTAQGVWGTGSIGYDGAGNIVSYALGTTNVLGASTRTYVYDTVKNRLDGVYYKPAPGYAEGWTPYSYDAYGNVSPTYNGYTYDTANNLIASATGLANTYDATNRRVKTVAGGVTTYEFRSAQGLLLAEWKKQSGYYDVLKEHIHVAGKEVAEQQTNFLGATIQPVTWMFLQHDASGSVLSSTWAGGGLLFKENYQPYGSQINGSAPGYTQRAFAGHKQDASDLI